MVAEAFDMEKPIVFTHEEVFYSTNSFSDSNLLGHGTYGSVYYGVLRDQVRTVSGPFVKQIYISWCLINDVMILGGSDKENDCYQN